MKKIKVLTVIICMFMHLCIRASLVEELYTRDNVYHDVKIEIYKNVVISGIGVNITVRIKNRTDKPIQLLSDSFYGLSLIPKETICGKVLTGLAILNHREISAAKSKDFLLLAGTVVASAFVARSISSPFISFSNALITRNHCTFLGGIIPLIFYDKFTVNEKKVAKECEKRKNNVLDAFKSELLFDPPVIVQPGELKEFDLYVALPTKYDNKLFIDIYDDLGKKVLLHGWKTIT